MPQSLATVIVHLIFSTKNREPYITPAIGAELYPYLTTVFQAQNCPALVVNGVADHVHCLFLLGRTVAVCDLVEEVKKSSSKWLKTQGDQYENFHWQAGYGAFSIGQSQVDAVREYIAGQEERHRVQSFQDEYRAFLRKYRIALDERYVWD